MTWVVDASVAVEWVLDTPLRAVARSLAGSEEPLIAPDLVLAEVANALWKLERIGRVQDAQIGAAMNGLAMTLAYTVATQALVGQALAIARSLDHPVYDCFYIALAEREDARVATMDRRLAGAVARTRWAPRVKLLAAR